MTFRVARMAPVKSGSFKARKAIPANITDEYAALHGRRSEQLFRAPPNCTPQQAKAFVPSGRVRLKPVSRRLRAKKRGEGPDPTHKQGRALADERYRWSTGPYDEDPGKSDCWAERHEALSHPYS